MPTGTLARAFDGLLELAGPDGALAGGTGSEEHRRRYLRTGPAPNQSRAQVEATIARILAEKDRTPAADDCGQGSNVASALATNGEGGI